jgi:hypothetical protein
LPGGGDTFNPTTWGAEASLIYRVSSRIARDTQRNPVSKKQTKKSKTFLKLWMKMVGRVFAKYV